MPKQKTIYIAALILSIVFATQLILIQLNVRGILSTLSFSILVRKRLISLEFLALCGLYLIWLIQSRPKTIASRYLELLKHASSFLIVAWLAHPLTSDIHLYLQYGLMSLYRINPYITAAIDFDSVVSTFLDWGQTSTYGVVSLFLFAISAKFVETNIYIGVYLFKLFCLSFHILNSYLIWRALKANAHRHKITLAYLLSPVLLFQQVTEAHIDVFLCTVVIAIDQLLKTRRYLLALLSTSVGFLTKTLPIIWIPLIGVFLIRQKCWRTLVKFTVICAIGVLILHFTVFPTSGAWKSVLNPGVEGMTAGSWHTVLQGVLSRTQAIVPNPTARSIVLDSTQAMIWGLFNRFTLLVFAAYYGITMYRIYRNRFILESQLMIQIGWVTFVLFAFATAWYQPWYATILLPVAVLNLQAPFFAITVFVFSLTGTAANLALGYGIGTAGILAAILTMGSTIVVLLLRPKIMAYLEAKVPRESGLQQTTR